jgi:hypothetical protein
MLTFNKNYFGLTLLIFTIEVLIALFVRDSFVRPYLGDVLVVILIYCFIRSFLILPVFPLAMCVLALSFTMEFLQYINIVEKLGLQHSKLARTVLGTSFVWNDLVAYTAGVAIVILVDSFLRKSK